MRAQILLLIAALICGCATVPVTGRRQLSFVSQDDLVGQSEQNFQQVLRQSTVSTDPVKNRELAEVMRRIACAAEVFMNEQGRQSQVAGYRWDVALLEDPDQVNAFTLPGGKIVAYTGIFKAANTPERLAAVVAHEAAHDIVNHAGERASQLLLLRFGETTLSAALSQSPEQTRQLLMAAFGAGSRFGFLLPYNRQQELEADRIGLIIMAIAGYDPRQAQQLWKNMAELERRSPVEFLSTHPSTERRLIDIRRHIPEALAYFRNAGRCSKDVIDDSPMNE